MTLKTQNLDNSLDAILERLGDFGKYQVYVFSLVCVSVVMHSMVHIAYVFTAMDLNYRCEIPRCDSLPNVTGHHWVAEAIPKQHNRLEKCYRYAELNHTDFNCSRGDFDTNIVKQCDNFVYAGSEKTILTEYDLHCEHNLWKLAMVGTVNNIGQFFGLMISGFLSDKYGRKVLLVWGMVLCSICGCIRAFMPTYQLFLLFEFLDAAFGSGSYICGFVLGVELVGPKNRVLTGTIVSCCYAVGEILVATFAWIVKSWKHLILIVYMPALLTISYLWLIPESIRWNISKGRIEEAKTTLKTLAKVNGKDISDKELEVLDIVAAERPDSGGKTASSLLEAVKSTTLMLRLASCCFCWITCTFLFYGLTLNSVSLVDGNNYLDFILTALVEIPAYFACNFVVDRFGRKKSLVFSYLLTGVACLSFIFIPSNSRWGSLAVYLLGKFGATAAFTILYVLTSEMFPTNLRHSFMGTCSTFGRCGSMISPQTPLLAHLWEPLPLISFSAMSIMAGLLTLLFPETLHKKLPDTVQEAENIGKTLPASDVRSNSIVSQHNPLEKY